MDTIYHHFSKKSQLENLLTTLSAATSCSSLSCRGQNTMMIEISTKLIPMAKITNLNIHQRLISTKRFLTKGSCSTLFYLFYNERFLKLVITSMIS